MSAFNAIKGGSRPSGASVQPAAAQQRIDTTGQDQPNAQTGASVVALDTRHDDNINDAQFDYYGTSLASCDSKGFLAISTLRNGVHETEATFQAHHGPIWQLAWAHPKYDSVIATGGFDGSVKVWQRDANGAWDTDRQAEVAAHATSVNCLAWAPWEYGLVLAVGTAEGRLCVYRREKDGQTWTTIKSGFIAHAEGVNAISWGPSTEPAILAQTENNQAAAGQSAASNKFQPPPKRLVSGGNDGKVRVWTIEGEESTAEMALVGEHDDWVRGVDWCQNIGLMHEMIASCSEDGSCKIWTSAAKGGKSAAAWVLKQKIELAEPGQDLPLWKVSWSQVGNMLAISGGDNQTHILSEEPNGDWKRIQIINEETSQESSGQVLQK